MPMKPFLTNGTQELMDKCFFFVLQTHISEMNSVRLPKISQWDRALITLRWGHGGATWEQVLVWVFHPLFHSPDLHFYSLWPYSQMNYLQRRLYTGLHFGWGNPAKISALVILYCVPMYVDLQILSFNFNKTNFHVKKNEPLKIPTAKLLIEDKPGM